MHESPPGCDGLPCEVGRRVHRRKRQANLETQLLHAIHETLVKLGVTLWRNNVGIASYPGEWGRSGGASKVRYGLGLGSADLVGCYKGRFVAIEVKRPAAPGSRQGEQTPEQKAWQRAVEQAGGLYALARSVDDAVRLVVGP